MSAEGANNNSDKDKGKLAEISWSIFEELKKKKVLAEKKKKTLV